MMSPRLYGLDAPGVWDTERAYAQLQAADQADTKRTAQRRLHALGILPDELDEGKLRDEAGRPLNRLVMNQLLKEARARRHLVLYAQVTQLPNGRDCLHANDARGARYWLPVPGKTLRSTGLAGLLQLLQADLGKALAVFPHGRLVALCRAAGALPQVKLLPYPGVLDLSAQRRTSLARSRRNPHLQRLEDQSIHIIREAVAEAGNPAMLFSAGKDSSVMLHLARKAFHPAAPPFPLLHIDTRWKFQELYLFRDHVARASGMDLLVHINPEAIEKNINPFDHGCALHTDITKTEGLKQALDRYRFDMVFGGARRDEEKSRAKERIFSLRSATHRWDPKNQRPELWNLYNTRKRPGESLRVFPLSDWTELDIWQYIHQEGIPVAPLYFARERPVVERDGTLLMVDDERFRLLPGEQIQTRKVRFRTLGCYPLTGAVESKADTLEAIVLELLNARSSERQGRKIDSDGAASMEKKKQEGYF
jgi:sulfate adenylyltransferase subunit 2